MNTLPDIPGSPDRTGFDSRFQWHCEPASWSLDPATQVLTIEPQAATDFWQRTHYGFRADNGHFLWTAAAQPFQMTVAVILSPRHQYDQGGLMVRLSPDCWLKTSIEYEDGVINRLGAVVTNGGYSDWSTQNVAADVTRFRLRVTRRGADYLAESRLDGGDWTQLRLAHLGEDTGSATVQCGIYACSPKQAGLIARFHDFSLTAGYHQ
jgi:regulation of enolase protein 1 (concanavalin A-like superfamily)